MVVACGGSTGAAPTATTSEPSTVGSATDSTTTAERTTASTMTEGTITVTTEDGLALEGRLFGSGSAYVVLAHMRPATMDSWFSFAELLASKGYSALVFNFRGYGASEGDGFQVDVDVVAAIDHAVSLGAEKMFVVGASMGGTGAIAAAAVRPVGSVVTLSAPARFEGVDAVAAASQVTAPILLIAGADNPPYQAEAEEIAAAAAGASDVRIVPSSAHGTNLLSEMGDPIQDLIINWLTS
jgi:pimeloyl-ACP methyl ester carboxylesterase